jgi:hypothetical protein
LLGRRFRDLEASRERERLEKLAEPRAHLCLEAAGAGEFVYLNDLEASTRASCSR